MSGVNRIRETIQNAIEACDPELFQAVSVSSDERFLVISAELSPSAALGNRQSGQAARVVRGVMNSYSPLPVPFNGWICLIAQPTTKTTNSVPA